MNIQKMIPSLLIAALAMCASALPSAAPLHGPQGHASVVTMMPIGRPVWRPVDAHVFAAPIGTAEDGYAGFAATAQAILPPPHHLLHQQLLIGPGAPHRGPYTAEIGHGVRASGLLEGSMFRSADFVNGQGIYLAWMNVPSPGTPGSSPDFAVGRVIPNVLFPIRVAGNALRNGSSYDPYIGTFDVPPINDPGLTPSFDVDGHSHFPVIYADNSDFGPPGTAIVGLYTYDVVMTDRSGSGWHIQAHFVVLPALERAEP